MIYNIYMCSSFFLDRLFLLLYFDTFSPLLNFKNKQAQCATFVFIAGVSIELVTIVPDVAR